MLSEEGEEDEGACSRQKQGDMKRLCVVTAGRSGGREANTSVNQGSPAGTSLACCTAPAALRNCGARPSLLPLALLELVRQAERTIAQGVKTRFPRPSA